MRQLFYGDFVRTIATAFDQALQNISAEYNFDLGDEFEVAICKILRRVLPQQFGICRGFVISKIGDVAGDDIIVYERMRFPTARLLDEDWNLKERVPIEAVLAYIEAKHSLVLEGDGAQSLNKALTQTAAVKTLCNRRESVPLNRIARGFILDSTIQAKGPAEYPPRKNPVYAAIIARHVRIKSNEPIVSSPQQIRTEMIARPQAGLSERPEMICAGTSVISLSAVVQPDHTRMITPFTLDSMTEMPIVVAENIAFGVAIAHLLWALDYIQLGDMPWGPIIGDALKG